MTKSKAKPKTTKRKGGTPLDEHLAAHAAGRPAPRGEKGDPEWRLVTRMFLAPAYVRRPR